MPQPKSDADSHLPKDFLWGAATSAHQVEGNQHNNWSVWEASVAQDLASKAEARLKNEVPDWTAIKDEATDPKNYISGIADNHYNRYEEDFDLIKDLGLNSYRFSIEWSRIEPQPGKYDQAALEHYAQMIKALRRRGIEPMVSLHHFTDPVWLEDHGGWHGKEVVGRFTEYARVVAEKLGPEVKYWISINEPGSYLIMRYLGGGAWPEWPIISMDMPKGFAYLRNLVKIHKQVQRVIKKSNPKAQVGMAHALIDYQLGRHDPISIITKKIVGYIPDGYLINRLKKDMDFIGVTYYMRMVIKSGFSNPANWGVKWNGIDPRNDMGWGIYPEGIYSVTQKVKKYDLPIYICENGIPDADDDQRSQYISDHLKALMRSRANGADVRGYFYWSLLDNYEWSEGFWPKFGLIAVDRKTLKRTIRPSAKRYSQLIKKCQDIR